MTSAKYNTKGFHLFKIDENSHFPYGRFTSFHHFKAFYILNATELIFEWIHFFRCCSVFSSLCSRSIRNNALVGEVKSLSILEFCSLICFFLFFSLSTQAEISYKRPNETQKIPNPKPEKRKLDSSAEEPHCFCCLLLVTLLRKNSSSVLSHQVISSYSYVNMSPCAAFVFV